MSKLDSKVRSLFRSEVLQLAAYQVADSSGYIKLDAMENPYSWPSDMVTEWLEILKDCQPNRYPDSSATSLKAVIKDCNNVSAAAGILLGNGSDELIQILLMAIVGTGATVIAPEPGFVMYRQIAMSLGIQYVGVPLQPNSFALDMKAMRDAIQQYNPALIFLAYPNNPTGNLFDTADVLEILDRAPNLVVMDEAYAPFAKATFMPKLSNFDRLLVMRTVSKLGLAGLRLGFLVGAPKWIEQLEKLRLPYNINVLTQMSTEFALSNYAVFEAQTQRICEDRDRLSKDLSQLDGVLVFPSRANFILFKLERQNADQVFASLKEAGILIKNVACAGGTLANCLRVTVGTEKENRLFFDSLKEILSL